MTPQPLSEGADGRITDERLDEIRASLRIAAEMTRSISSEGVAWRAARELLAEVDRLRVENDELEARGNTHHDALLELRASRETTLDSLVNAEGDRRHYEARAVAAERELDAWKLRRELSSEANVQLLEELDEEQATVRALREVLGGVLTRVESLRFQQWDTTQDMLDAWVDELRPLAAAPSSGTDQQEEWWVEALAKLRAWAQAVHDEAQRAFLEAPTADGQQGGFVRHERMLTAAEFIAEIDAVIGSLSASKTERPTVESKVSGVVLAAAPLHPRDGAGDQVTRAILADALEVIAGLRRDHPGYCDRGVSIIDRSFVVEADIAATLASHPVPLADDREEDEHGVEWDRPYAQVVRSVAEAMWTVHATRNGVPSIATDSLEESNGRKEIAHWEDGAEDVICAVLEALPIANRTTPVCLDCDGHGVLDAALHTCPSCGGSVLVDGEPPAMSPSEQAQALGRISRDEGLTEEGWS